MDLSSIANFGDIIEWLSVAFAAWGMWSAAVTGVVQNLKPQYNEVWNVIKAGIVLLRLPAELAEWLRRTSIIVLVLVAAWISADGGYNLFASFPGRLPLNATLLTAINAILLAGGAFYLHGKDIANLFNLRTLFGRNAEVG